MPSKKPSYYSSRPKKDASYTGVEDPSIIREEIPFQASTLETIDTAMFRWVDEDMNISTDTNTGFNKVPVLWVSAERAFQIKRNKGLRDQDGTLVLPLITIERATVAKSLTKKGTVYNAFPIQDEQGGAITIALQINQEKTANFANADSLRRKDHISDNPTVGISQQNFPRPNNILRKTMCLL